MIYNSPCVAPTAVSVAKKLKCFFLTKTYDFSDKQVTTRNEFARGDKHGYVFLRNHRGYCFFYDVTKHRCRAYSIRPLGCRVYPVVCSDENVVLVDELCPMGRTVSRGELRKKGLNVVELLRRIDTEAKARAETKRVR